MALIHGGEQVLSLVWQSHKPLGAYSLMEMLALESTRRVAPPTVYRALEFLLEEGLIHRINCLNAFVGCPSPNHKHQSHFLICRKCGNALELGQSDITQAINSAATTANFIVEIQSVEVTGVCVECK